MHGPTWIRVVLWLVFLGARGVAAVPFTPLAEPLALPESMRGKAVWALLRLADGRLAAGFEGGIALGVPHGDWTIVATPHGSPVQAIVAAHGRILAAGGGCAGFVEQGGFEPIAGLHAPITEALEVPEGWLVAGPTGLWLVTPQATARLIESATTGGHPTLARWRGETLALWANQAPGRWADGRLVEFAAPAPAALLPVRQLRDDLWFTDAGVIAPDGQTLLPASVSASLLDEAGLTGVAHEHDRVLCATYWRGLLAYRSGAADPDWQWSGLGSCYTLTRDGTSLLVGSTQGGFALADPAQARIARFEEADILHLQAEPGGGARVVTLRGMVDCGDIAPTAPDSLWPAVTGLRVTANTVELHGRSVQLPTRYLNGLAACGGSIAVAFGNTVLISAGAVPVVSELSSGITSLANDPHGFFVGTHADGIQTFDTSGRRLAQLGTGRAKARQLAPDRLCLLFWEGEVRDSATGPGHRLPFGNPRDAALVEVARPDGSRLAGQLAVLATRADGPPVLGCLADGAWTALEVPGLATIDAETLSAGAGCLYIGGRHGVLEIRMPLRFATPPAPTWHWNGADRGLRHALPLHNNGQVVLVPGRWEAPASTPTGYRVRLPNGAWTEAHPGVPLTIPVNWGRNHLALVAERHGLATRRELAVDRPYPLPLRPWALVLEFLLLAAAVWWFTRLRTRHLLRQKRALEAAVEQRTAQLRKANAAKEEFLASVSHEIRNPLNGVVGICAILQDSALGPRERNFVQVLSGCAEQLRSMLDDVLDFSLIDRGATALHPAPFEACALVEEAVRVMDPLLESCALQLPETPQWLEGDTGKIRQIVCNLVSNALKYGRPREAGIELRLTPEPGGRFRLRLAVHNAGPTIPAADLPRLFESFRRGAGTEGTPGFGLGLAVCRRLAERMGGRMTAASRDGTTEFALELALPASAAPASDTGPVAVVSRALAIEDEDYNRLALGHALRSLGYEVDWATDGASALQLARRQPYDLVLTDWRLPDINGDELCRQLLAVLPPPRPPIVAVTAYSSAEKLAAARAAGMAGFVTKPVTREKLAQVIHELDTGPRPRPSLDLAPARGLPPALAMLGELAPTLAQLAADLGTGWQQAEAQARLRDPRTGRAAHALRSLLLLAGEDDLAEQLGLLEGAAEAADWDSVEKLLPFLAAEVLAARERLASGRP